MDKQSEEAAEMEAARREEAELAAELRRERVELTLRLRGAHRALAAAEAAAAPPDVIAAHRDEVTETRAAIEGMLGRASSSHVFTDLFYISFTLFRRLQSAQLDAFRISMT